MIELDDGSHLGAVEQQRRGELVTRQALLAERRRKQALARRRARIRRNRLVAATLAVVTGIGLWSVLASAGGAVGHRKASSARAATVLDSALHLVRTVPGALPAFPWPGKGQGAVAVLGEGLMVRSPRTPVVPIASLTKMMTAYVVLHDHPLAAGAEGPTFTMSAADVAGYVHADQTDESNVPVHLGEHLTEHQLLEALLIPSADNIADLLASWDAGSIPAFVHKMNATAAALGLRSTHYGDASGVNPASRSDASDQAILAAALMENPVVRGIVSKHSLRFPVAGTIWNYNPALGLDGVIGVKSGFTSAAQGCLATAAFRSAAGHHVLVVAVSLGQPGGLGEAAQVDRGLLNLAGHTLVGYRVPLPPTQVATVDASSGQTPLYVGGAAPVVVAWPGMKLRLHVVADSATTAAAPAASLVVSSPVADLERVPLTNVVPATVTGANAPVSTAATTTSLAPAG